MSTTISPQVRAIALAGFLIALAIGLGVLALSHSHSGSKPVAPPAIKPLHPHVRSAAPARATHTKTPTQASKRSHHAATTHPATKPAVVAPKTLLAPRLVTPKVAVAPKEPVITAANGLPLAVAQALRKNSVVVVALYQASRQATGAQRRQAQAGSSAAAAVGIDQLALGEAAAGAKDAKAGFVGVDVLSESQASPLAALLGVLTDPTVLVYTRPATLTVKIAGFADRATVAQAAADAATAQ